MPLLSEARMDMQRLSKSIVQRRSRLTEAIEASGELDTMLDDARTFLELCREGEEVGSDLTRAVAKLEPGENLAVIAAGVEFILEGLHLNKRLNKDKSGRLTQYRG